MNNHNLKVMFSADELREKVAELGSKITQDYAGNSPVMVCILRGACIFFADLIRNVDLNITIDFMALSSYGKCSKSSGQVKMIKDLSCDIAGRDVIIVEDIIDSGYTARYIRNLLSVRNPKSIALCSILDKPSRREVDVECQYVGFHIPDEFVVGYGLDYDSKYRNLKDLCILEMPKDAK